MKFKILLLLLAVFITKPNAQEERHPCFNKETVQKRMVNITKNKNWWNIIAKLGLLGIKEKKHIFFKEEFSQLTPDQQQQKIEKWLINNKRKEKIIELYKKLSEFQQSKKLDDETIETVIILQDKVTEFSPKDLYLFQACSPTNQLSQEEQHYIDNLQKRVHFNRLRKEESLRHQNRVQELEKLEQQALNDFKTLEDFLDHDNWSNRRAQK